MPTSQYRVSVIVPAYNTERYIAQCLDSLVGQTLSCDAYEVIVVDDGSTDASGTIADRYAAGSDNLRVIHEQNSGWAGRPRNTGIDAALGEYLFFCDSDDYMAPDALERICDFAEGHESDVVLPPRVRFDEHKQWGAEALYAHDQVDADMVQIFATLSPQKLMRRSFLQRYALRYPEEKVRLEDGIFLAEAYLRADRVSVLGGAPAYFLRQHPDSISHSGVILPVPYINSVQRITDQIVNWCGDHGMRDHLIADLYRRKVLSWIEMGRFARHTVAARGLWLHAAHRYAKHNVTSAIETFLEYPLDEWSKTLRSWRYRNLNKRLAFAKTTAVATMLDVGHREVGVVLEGWPAKAAPMLVARERKSRITHFGPDFDPHDESAVQLSLLPELAPESDETLDFFVADRLRSVLIRVAVAPGLEQALPLDDDHGRRFYRSVQGDLSERKL